MPSVPQLKALFQNQIAPGSDEEFLRLLTEADMRLTEWGRWSFTRGKETLTPADNHVTLPAKYASILGARVDKQPVDIMGDEYEYVPGGRGEIDLGVGYSKLIDQGMIEGVQVSGGFTPGSTAFLPTTGTLNGKDAFSQQGNTVTGSAPSGNDQQIAYSTDLGVWVFTVYVAGVSAGVWVSEATTFNSPTSVTTWTSFGAETGEPVIEEAQFRRYKIAGHLDDDDVVTALMHYAPVTLMDPDIADSTLPDDATVNTRCPDATALKLMMLGILMEEAHDHGGARSYISDALKGLDNKEQSQRGNAQRTIQSRPMGRNVRRIGGWR